ncbi:MAG: hypothetical protein EXX96DRAFT_266256 [Benjaminiella poitrasii]|nr:MAG: hypothetical protein EXX96DRAFT_266256 [Benjaminiella poitrasii]
MVLKSLWIDPFNTLNIRRLEKNTPAPANLVKMALGRFAKERGTPAYIVNIDEYFTPPICPFCTTHTTDNEKDSNDDRICPVKVCSTCNKRYIRDQMASMNIRKEFLHMAAHNNERPLVFVRN